VRYEGPKAVVADLTRLGVEKAVATCFDCRHEADLMLADFEPHAVFVEIRQRLKCARCGSRDVGLMPDWRAYRPVGRI
jgi:Zn finger protein HypA/HybF involved in hydrogenase expression